MSDGVYEQKPTELERLGWRGCGVLYENRLKFIRYECTNVANVGTYIIQECSLIFVASRAAVAASRSLAFESSLRRLKTFFLPWRPACVISKVVSFKWTKHVNRLLWRPLIIRNWALLLNFFGRQAFSFNVQRLGYFTNANGLTSSIVLIFCDVSLKICHVLLLLWLLLAIIIHRYACFISHPFIPV